ATQTSFIAWHFLPMERLWRQVVETAQPDCGAPLLNRKSWLAADSNEEDRGSNAENRLTRDDAILDPRPFSRSPITGRASACARRVLAPLQSRSHIRRRRGG